jgi:hypothetical protein
MASSCGEWISSLSLHLKEKIRRLEQEREDLLLLSTKLECTTGDESKEGWGLKSEERTTAEGNSGAFENPEVTIALVSASSACSQPIERQRHSFHVPASRRATGVAAHQQGSSVKIPCNARTVLYLGDTVAASPYHTGGDSAPYGMQGPTQHCVRNVAGRELLEHGGREGCSVRPPDGGTPWMPHVRSLP